MNTKRVNAAAQVIFAAQKNGYITATGWAMALESAQLLQSPETAAEMERLRANERAAVSDAEVAEASRERWRAAALTAEQERDALRARVAELEAERHVRNEALDDAVQELRRRDEPAQAKPTLSPETAMIVAAGPLCSCIRFPAAHRADMHDENWQVRDVEAIPSEGWSQMKHAKCMRCGWVSKDSWLQFDNWVVQTRIAEMHRHRWTDECLPDAGAAPSLEDPHDSPLHHRYRLGRDLPETAS